MMMLIYDLLEEIQKDKKTKRQKRQKKTKETKKTKRQKKIISLPALCCTCHFHSDALCGGVKLAKISNHPHNRILAV